MIQNDESLNIFSYRSLNEPFDNQTVEDLESLKIILIVKHKTFFSHDQYGKSSYIHRLNIQ